MSFDDARRLRALDEYEILNTEPEAVFDNIVELAAKIFATPIALVTLVADKTQWFKAHHGVDLEQTPREYAFCDHAIRGDATMTITDAVLDPRFAQNPLVLGDPYIRFYCGVPIRTPDRQALGTLCIIDREPRSITPAEIRGLEALARQVEIELEIRRRLLILERGLALARDRQRTRELLAAMIVHDMRNPLAVIIVLAGAITAADDESKLDLRTVLAEAERLRRMLTDILDVCLHEVGSLPLRRMIFPIAPVVNEVLGRIKQLDRKSRCSLKAELADPAQQLDGDPELVTRLLENLAANAVNHGSAAPEVTIAVLLPRDGRVQIEVRDNGPLIPEQDRIRIFEALERGSAPTKTAGHGLGLTFCRMAVQAHGGQIATKPNPSGVGNCFALDLPAAELLSPASDHRAS